MTIRALNNMVLSEPGNCFTILPKRIDALLVKKNAKSQPGGYEKLVDVWADKIVASIDAEKDKRRSQEYLEGSNILLGKANMPPENRDLASQTIIGCGR